jgi:protein translocase SecG subunit
MKLVCSVLSVALLVLCVVLCLLILVQPSKKDADAELARERTTTEPDPASAPSRGKRLGNLTAWFALTFLALAWLLSFLQNR